MRFKKGDEVKVVNHKYSGRFQHGDVIKIVKVGSKFDPVCYEAISPHDGHLWFIYDDEIDYITNGDWIRSLDNDDLSDFLETLVIEKDTSNIKDWINSNRT